MSRRSQVKMMVYSQDGFGLGHLRRNLNIAIQLHRRSPDARILLVADSPAAPFFKLPPHCDFVKIPTIVKVNTGVWRSDRLSLEDRELLRIRAQLVEEIVTSFRPDLFLVDHMPCGALGELSGPLEAMKTSSPNTRMLLGLRDILGAPADICRQWHQDQHYAAAAAYYDAVFIYGSRELFDLVEEYRFPEAVLAKTHYCGYVSREHVSLSGTNGNGNGNGNGAHNGSRLPLVLVTGGGGADSSFFIDKFLDATAILTKRMRFQAIVATGPFMHADQYVWLHEKARGLPVRVTRSQDSIRLMRRADVVISMAGYNTVSEILKFRKKAIVIPRPGPSAEQTMRTKLMAARGLFNTIHPHVLTSEELASTIGDLLRRTDPVEPSFVPRLDGASQVAEFMLARLAEVTA